MKDHGIFLCWGETRPARDKATIFFLILKGAKAQVLCSQPLTLGPSEGRVHIGVMQGECGVGGSGDRSRGVALGFSVLVYTWIPQQSPCLRRASTSPEKRITLPCGILLIPPFLCSLAPSTLHLFLPFYVGCLVFFVLFYVGFFLFFSPILHLNPY